MLAKFFERLRGSRKSDTNTPADSTAGNFSRARDLQQRGKLPEAALLYQSVLASGEQELECLAELAAIALQSGDFDGVVRLYDASIARDACRDESHYKRANALNHLQRWEEALAGYDRAIALNAGYAAAYCNRGAVLERLGRQVEALDSYERAIAIDPRDSFAYYNRAAVLVALERLEEAIMDYDRAVSLNTGYVEAFINRGHLLRELARHSAAIDSYDQAIRLKPVHAEAFYGRAQSLARLGQPERALENYARALALRNDYAAAYIGQGQVLRSLRRNPEAIESFGAGLRLDPACADGFEGLGYCLLGSGLIDAAVASFNHSLALNPGGKYVFGMRRHAQMQMCDWQGLDTDLSRLETELTLGRPVAMPFVVLALLDSARSHRLAAETWVREECPADDSLGLVARRRRADKIKLGYFSADFCAHPVGMLTAEIFELHDRSRFDITAFALGPSVEDSVRARLRTAFDSFVDVAQLSDEEVASLAREKRIDIAIDLGGFTTYSRTKIFAKRAAPLQASYIGYLGTMGAPYMDYLLADSTLIPADRQLDYAEKIIYLPSYQANDSHRACPDASFARDELGLPPSGFVFCCFNANYKITPATFGLWMDILRRVPGSCLFLYVDNPMAQANLQRYAARSEVDPARIVFGSRVPYDAYLARLRAMDLFLDTLPYNAGTTASDALWMGLPVLTRAGDGLAGRMAASLLTAIELTELITQTADQYVSAAVELAMNPARLTEIRQKLAQNRLATRLFDTRLFVASLEEAFTQAYERYHAGLDPEHIYPRR